METEEAEEVFKVSTEDSRGKFPASERERDKHQRPEKKAKSWEAGWGRGKQEQEVGVQTSIPSLRSNRQGPRGRHRNSLLPFQWRITHSSRWIAQVLASELSLVAFVLLLVMVFSRKWLYLPGSRFYQRWPTDVTNRIYTSSHIMSMGLLHICRSNSENGKVSFIFSTLMLFPINLWIFELESNISIPIGWSYFTGWLVFVLYVTCGIICYFNHKHFWSVILEGPSGTVFSSSGSSSVEISLRKQTVTDTSIIWEGVLDPEKKNTHL
ncbi:LOW QUALITY PROTEIN: outer dense fiber protein 4 [Carlito syrichta]|uniref:LOW QUALITY PROTEIN: outer dense fiber protein 4 n=1 Tax=Carlito syrichta TaxID=1868482 RepID=A0A1U7TSG3_CARSF|nr:LOW QUALITY PROTEIN: outer dense fiber protein 4 [Carlito syrichta]